MSVRVRGVGAIAAAAGTIAVLTLVSRVVGFGRWLVFSHAVGATCVGEAYATTNLLPNVLYEVAAGGALAAVVVPLVGGALARGQRERSDQIASALLTWALSIVLPAAVALAVLAPVLARAMLGSGGGPGCASADQQRVATAMIVIFAPQVPLYVVSVVLAGILQSHHRFVAAAATPLLSSLVVIPAYLGYSRLASGTGGDPGQVSAAAIAVLAGGTTLGVVALAVPLWIPVRASGVRLRVCWRFPPHAAAVAGRLAGAGMVALLAQQASVLATAVVANRGTDTGTLNVYAYAQAVSALPLAVLAVPIATAAFPHLVSRTGVAPSAQPAGAQPAGALPPPRSNPTPDVPPEVPADAPAPVLARTLAAVLVAGALGAAVLVSVAPAAAGLFNAIDASRGADTAAGLPAMSTAVGASAPGLVGLALIGLLQRALYLRGSAWLAALTVAAGWLVAAVVPLLSISAQDSARRKLTVLGWSSSAGMCLAAIVLLLLVRRAWGPAALRGLGPTAAAVALVGLSGAGLGRVVVDQINGPQVGRSIIAGIAGSAVVVGLFTLIRWLAPAAWAGLLRRRPAVPAAADQGPE